MKNKLTFIFDLILIAVLVYLLYNWIGLTTGLVLLFQLPIAGLYVMCYKMFYPLAKAIPTINTSWLSMENVSIKKFVVRRVIEFLFSYAILLLLWRLL